MAVLGSKENLPFIFSVGAILCDVLVNLLCNDISSAVQGSSFAAARFIPYLVWVAITVLWFIAKCVIRRLSNIRKYDHGMELLLIFVGTLLCDILINLLCNNISEKVQEETFVGERFVPYGVLSGAAVLWVIVKRMMENRQPQTEQSETENVETSPETQQPTIPHGIFQLNDSVWECHPPVNGIPEMDILFFHGLPLGHSKDAFWETWLARDNEQVVWPKEWLGKTYPNARILLVSYYHCLYAETDGGLDLEALERNLVKDIILAKHLNIGQNCPVILVGHSLGGVIIQKFLLTAMSMKRTAIQPITNRVDKFLENFRGVFYYAIPHGRSRIQELAEQIPSHGRPTLELLKTIDAKTLDIAEEFGHQCRTLNARSFAVLEGRETKLLRFHQVVVGGVSARYDVNRSYIDTTADHFAVCRPASMEATTYTILVQFVAAALADGMIRQYAGLVLRRIRPGHDIGQR